MGQQFKPILMSMQGVVQSPPPGMFKWFLKNILICYINK
jgi:hypothetical protein